MATVGVGRMASIAEMCKGVKVLQIVPRESTYTNTICTTGCRANESLGHIVQLSRDLDKEIEYNGVHRQN